MSNAKRDQNHIPGTLVESTDGDGAIVPLRADPVTHRLQVEGVVSEIVPYHDKCQATYPTTSTELYTFTLAGITVATLLVTYTDATKEVFDKYELTI